MQVSSSIPKKEPTDKPGDFLIRPNVNRLFDQKRDSKTKPTEPIVLAEWALMHGLVGKFVETMDKMVLDEKDKLNPAVVAYRQVKDRVNAPLPDPNPESEWVKRLKSSGV